MPEPKQAIVLRVHRNIAGVSFPWDCVYFFRRSEESLLPKIFPCSLVLSMNKQLTRLVKGAIDNPRGDIEPSRAYPHHRKDETKLDERVKRQPPVQAVFENPRNFVALIPTLHLKGNHVNGRSGPTYLTARPRAPSVRSTSEQRRRSKRGPRMVFTEKGKFVSSKHIRTSILKKLVSEAISSEAYFLFYEEKIQPVCLCCPNNLEYLDGKCLFGEERCYASLDQARDSNFIEALNLFKQLSSHVTEEAEVTNEQLSRNEV